MTVKVIQGRWFWHSRKRVWHFLLVVNGSESNLGPILLRFRDITAFVRRNPLFLYPTSVSAKISRCYSWTRSVMLGSAESEHPMLTNHEIIFEDFNLCHHNPPTSQTDRRHAIAGPHFALSCIAR